VSCYKDDLEMALVGEGFVGIEAKQRTDYEALVLASREAAGCFKKPDRTITIQSLRRKSQNGLEATLVDKGNDRNEYSQGFSARVDKHGNVTVSVTNWSSMGVAERDVQTSFDRYKSELPVGSVRSVMEQCILRISGLKVKVLNGLYWLPESGVEIWEQTLQPLFRSFKCDDFVLRTDNTDPEEVRLVTNAISELAAEQVSKVMADLTENDLSESAVFKRRLEVADLTRRLGEYEECLGTTLGVLKESVRKTDMALAAAYAVEQDTELDLFSEVVA
jgi:hypothetical protein